MKMQLPKWLRRADASAQELVEQKTATALDLASALEAEKAAQDAFMVSGTVEARQALQDARQAVADVQLDAERADALARQAEAATAAAERAALELKLAAMISSLTGPDSEDQRLAEVEAQALLSAVKAREARVEHLGRRAEQEREVERMRQALGQLPSAAHVMDFTSRQPSAVVVADRLRELARGHESVGREYLHQIALAIDPHWVQRSQWVR